MLADTIGDTDVRAITRRFQLALAGIGAATVLGALLPLAGVCLFTSFLAYYWLPVSGELGMARPRARPTGPVANNADGAVQAKRLTQTRPPHSAESIRLGGSTSARATPEFLQLAVDDAHCRRAPPTDGRRDATTSTSRGRQQRVPG